MPLITSIWTPTIFERSIGFADDKIQRVTVVCACIRGGKRPRWWVDTLICLLTQAPNATNANIQPSDLRSWELALQQMLWCQGWISYARLGSEQLLPRGKEILSRKSTWGGVWARDWARVPTYPTWLSQPNHLHLRSRHPQFTRLVWPLTRVM